MDRDTLESLPNTFYENHWLSKFVSWDFSSNHLLYYIVKIEFPNFVPTKRIDVEFVRQSMYNSVNTFIANWQLSMVSRKCTIRASVV